MSVELCTNCKGQGHVRAAEKEKTSICGAPTARQPLGRPREVPECI